MHDFAELTCALACPRCSKPILLPDGTLRFQWGLVPARYASAPVPLRWLRGPGGGLMPPYDSGALDPEEEAEWNAGAPEENVVFAFDDDPRLAGLTCPHCQAPLERIAVRIERDVLWGAVAFFPGELARKLSAKPGTYAAVVVRADGAWEPRPDWEALEAEASVEEDL